MRKSSVHYDCRLANDLQTNLRFNSENTIKNAKDLAKINTEIVVNAFQSHITCGWNPMDGHPINLFPPSKSSIVNIGKYVSGKTLYNNILQRRNGRICKMVKVQNGRFCKIFDRFCNILPCTPCLSL